MTKAVSPGAQHGSERGTSDNGAKFYSVTAAGRRRVKAETERWNRTALAMNTALRAQEAS